MVIDVMVLCCDDVVMMMDVCMVFVCDFVCDGWYGDDVDDVECGEWWWMCGWGGFWMCARCAALALGVTACACASGAGVVFMVCGCVGVSVFGV